MEELVQLFRTQQATGFADVAGARAAVTIPVSDRLLNLLLAQRIPSSAPVRDVRISSRAGNTFSVSFAVARAAFLPTLSVRLSIERQPDLPRSSILVLRVAAGGLMALAGPALRLFDVLPPGLRLDGDRLLVDLRALAAQHGLGEWFSLLQSLQITTADGRLIVSAEAALPAGSPAPPQQS